MGSPTLKGTETLFTSRTCHETHNYIVCTYNTLQPFSPNDSKLISVESVRLVPMCLCQCVWAPPLEDKRPP